MGVPLVNFPGKKDEFFEVLFSLDLLDVDGAQRIISLEISPILTDNHFFFTNFFGESLGTVLQENRPPLSL